MSLRKALALRMAKRYVCGGTVEDAIEGARVANRRGIAAKINFLGESVTDDSMADSNLREYLNVQRAISDSQIDGCISVKLTQFGLELSEKGTEERLEKLVREANTRGQMVWIDMESSKFLERTLSIYESILRQHKNAGITLQSYLKRSEKDLERLVRSSARIRLVKGAYSESSELLFQTKLEIRQNFEKLMEALFDKKLNFSVATHDHRLIDFAKGRSESKVQVEFEKLKGIGDEFGFALAASGYRVSEYVPYGKQWYRYFLRRMNAKPGYLWPVLRKIIWRPPD